jgi:hypothetical protein
VKYNYQSTLFQIEAEVGKALTLAYPHKQLWKVKEPLRLVKLKVWEERYHVSLTYVLKTILGHWYATMPKDRRTKARDAKSLGIGLAQLTGVAAESILKEKVMEDFPDGENEAIHKQDERDRILEFLDQELPTRQKSILAYSKISDFVASYRKSIDRRRRETDTISVKMSRMAWRGNPFR